VSESKCCPSCQATFPKSHWAFARELCPVCGTLLQEGPAEKIQDPKYEHFDSSSEIRFELEGLLAPEQRREALLIGCLGLGSVILAVAARILYVALAGLDGFWSMPLWFDLIIGLLLLLGAGMVLWCGHRLLSHRRALRRSLVVDQKLK
jgi:hypothetical protein